MGKFLMYSGFFVALIGVGQMIAEAIPPVKVKFFTLSLAVASLGFLLFLAGEFLERRKKRWGSGVNNPGAGMSFRRRFRTSVRTANVLLLNLRALFLLRKLGVKRFY